MPNWLNLQSQKPIQRPGRPLKREDTGEEESPEEIRQRNIKEAEILLGNLAEGGQHEIISDLQQLKSLGLLQETMVRPLDLDDGIFQTVNSKSFKLFSK